MNRANHRPWFEHTALAETLRSWCPEGKPRAASRPGVLEHLGIADRIAEGGIRTAADHQLDALGLPCVS